MILLNYPTYKKFQELQFCVSKNLKTHINQNKSKYFVEKFFGLYRLALFLVSYIVYYGLFIENLPIISKLGQANSNPNLSLFLLAYLLLCIIVFPILFTLIKEIIVNQIKNSFLNRIYIFKKIWLNKLLELACETTIYPILICMPKLIAESFLPLFQVNSIVLSPTAFQLDSIKSLNEYNFKMLLAINIYAFAVSILLILTIVVISPNITLAISPLINNFNKNPLKRAIHPFDYIVEKVLEQSYEEIQDWDEPQDIISIVDNKINGLSTQSQSIQTFLGVASFISLYTLIFSEDQINRFVDIRIATINLRDFLFINLCLIIIGSCYYFMQLYWSLHVLRIVRLTCVKHASQKRNSDIQVNRGIQQITTMNSKEGGLQSTICKFIRQFLQHL